MRKPIMEPRARVDRGRVLLSWKRRTELLEHDPEEAFAWFRIYRQETPEFTGVLDRQEFFMGMDGQDAELIYEGALVPVSNRVYEYLDTQVQVASTYVYFIQTPHSGRIGPIPVMVRDPVVWWPYADLLARLEALRKGWPELVQVSMCGETVTGRGIPCLQIGHGQRVLGLIGLTHAGESGPELMVPALEALLEEAPEIFEQAQVIAIPAHNIDGREAMIQGAPSYIRKNLQGIDLNRNFPANWHEIDHRYGGNSTQPTSGTYRGPHPGSAPETKAVMSLFTAHKPGAVLGFHWLSSICGLPALATRKAEGDEAYVQACQRIITLYGQGLFPDGEGLKSEFHDPDTWLRLAPTGGTMNTWFYDLERIPSMTLEGGLMEAGMTARLNKTDQPLLREFQQRHKRALKNVLTHWFE